MRLIDYDALEQYAVEYQERHKGDELTREEFKLIDNFMFECPKTDAIPVEWLQRRRDIYMKAYHAGHESEIHTAAIINDALKAWQKGQEAR